MGGRLPILYLVLGLALLPAWAASAAPPQPAGPTERPLSLGLAARGPSHMATMPQQVQGRMATSEALGIEFVSQIGGWSAQALAIYGDYVYAADGGLRTIDATASKSPVETALLDLGPDMVKDIAVAGHYLYSVNGYDLSVITVADPAHPSRIGYKHLSGCSPTYGVAAAGSYAYAADWCVGLHIVDASNPAALVERGVYDTPGNAYGVAVQGNYAYVADGSKGLRIVDVSTPDAPVGLGWLDTPGTAWKVAVAGQVAYVADRDGGLRIINVSNPDSPLEVGAITTFAAYDVAVAGNYAYVAHSLGPSIFDVTDPSAPVEVGSFDAFGSWAVAVNGPYIYDAAQGGGLLTLWFSPPVIGAISPSGGTLTSLGDNTAYAFPAGAFPETVIVTHVARFPGNAPAAGKLVGIDHVFDVSVVYQSSGLPAQLASGQSYMVTVDYRQSDVGVAQEDTLALYWWDGAAWSQEGISSSVDTSANRVTAEVNHFSLFTVLGDTNEAFLPLVMR